MSEEKVLCSNVLTIRIDQHEDNRVTWHIDPDDKVWETQTLSLIELAECGCLSVLVCARVPICATGSPSSKVRGGSGSAVRTHLLLAVVCIAHPANLCVLIVEITILYWTLILNSLTTPLTVILPPGTFLMTRSCSLHAIAKA